MHPTEYEQALAEKLRYEFLPPNFEVFHNWKVKGKYSRGNRQIDVAVRRRGEKRPFLVAEAKQHISETKKVDIGYIDAFIVKLLEVDAGLGIMVTTSGFSRPGERLAKHFGIDLRTMTIDKALETRWYAVARRIFPLDWAFHPHIGEGLHRLNRGDEPQAIIEAIEEVPFEAWETYVKYALSNYPSEATEFLWFIATHHYDDGWRYNAVQQLIEYGVPTEFNMTALVSQETDPEIIELLRDSGFV